MQDDTLFVWIGFAIIVYVAVIVIEVGVKLWRLMK